MRDTFCTAVEVLIALATKSYIFWGIMPCSPLKIDRRFGETCHIHLATCFKLWLFAWCTLRLWRLRWDVPPKRRWIFNGLFGVISHKIKVFIHFVSSTVSLSFNSCGDNWTVVSSLDWIVTLCLGHFIRLNASYFCSWAAIRDVIVHERKMYHVYPSDAVSSDLGWRRKWSSIWFSITYSTMQWTTFVDMVTQ
jgi:hypothetical protein